MDASDVREGTTVYLPVFHPGALFYFGDGHAAQGDGEVCGSGLETAMDVAFRFGLVKGKAIEWPRLEDATHVMVAGSARPLSDALRIAFVELIAWLEADYGFARADAYRTAILRGLRSVAQLTFKDNVDMFYAVRRARLRGGVRTTAYDNQVRVDNVQHNLLAIMKILDTDSMWSEAR